MVRLSDGDVAPRWEPLPEAEFALHVAGLPQVGWRVLSPREELLLRLLGYGGCVLAAGGGYVLADVLALIGRRGDLTTGAVLTALAGGAAIRIGWRYGGAALRALRFDRIAVFQGEIRSMQGLDGAQARLSTKGRPPREILTTPDGRTLLRSDVGGFRHFGLRVRASRIAADRGDLTRDLTERERRELAALVRLYGFPRVSLLLLALVPAASLASIGLSGRFSGLTWIACVVLALPFIALFQYGRYQWTLFRLAKGLRQDLAEGRIVDGRLASGIPWLVADAPAPWRRARPATGAPVDANLLRQTL